jgi:hypothetical protein
MGLLTVEGKMLKHLKEKPHHKIQYHNLSFLWRNTPQQTLRRHRNLKASSATLLLLSLLLLLLLPEFLTSQI